MKVIMEPVGPGDRIVLEILDIAMLDRDTLIYQVAPCEQEYLYNLKARWWKE